MFNYKQRPPRWLVASRTFGEHVMRFFFGMMTGIVLAIALQLVLGRFVGLESRSPQLLDGAAQSSAPAAEPVLGHDPARLARVAELSATDVQTRLTAYKALLHEQGDYLKVLIQIAGDKQGPPGTRYHAVRLLGDLASPRAVRVLVENIDWQFPGELDIVTESTGLEGYPCAMALRRCGINCLPEILLGLSRTSPDELTDGMIETRASVLSEVYDAGIPLGGEDEAIAVIERFLRHVLPLSATGKRENVERLLGALKKRVGGDSM